MAFSAYTSAGLRGQVFQLSVKDGVSLLWQLKYQQAQLRRTVDRRAARLEVAVSTGLSVPSVSPQRRNSAFR